VVNRAIDWTRARTLRAEVVGVGESTESPAVDTSSTVV
jgi:hypothetical protein